MGLFFLLATWLYLLSELLLLGAVYNRFRMGEPVKEGLIASPMHESLESKRPVEAIKQKKVEPSEAGEPRRRRPRSLFHRVAPGVVKAVVVAGVVRRKARKRIAT